MRILVLGGSGLLGRKTVLHLLRDQEISLVVSSDVAPPKEWFIKSIENCTDKFRFVRGDVSQLEDILDTIKTYSINRVINLAFLLPGVIEAQPPRQSIKVNALGMCNAFEAARLLGVSRVVYASSEGVYGPQDEYGDREVNEDDHLHPRSGYHLTKQLSEILAEQYTKKYKMNFTALRPAIIYGHGGLSPIDVKQFSDIVSLPAVGKPFSTQVDGTIQYSLAFVDDVAAFTGILIKAQSSPRPVYNVGGPPTSLRDMAKVVRKCIPDAKLKFGNQAPPSNRGRVGIPWKVSMSRAKEDFGFDLMPLEEAVMIHINDARLEAGLKTVKE